MDDLGDLPDEGLDAFFVGTVRSPQDLLGFAHHHTGADAWIRAVGCLILNELPNRQSALEAVQSLQDIWLYWEEQDQIEPYAPRIGEVRTGTSLESRVRSGLVIEE